MLQLIHKDFIHKYPPQFITRYEFIPLNVLEQLAQNVSRGSEPGFSRLSIMLKSTYVYNITIVLTLKTTHSGLYSKVTRL